MNYTQLTKEKKAQIDILPLNTNIFMDLMISQEHLKDGIEMKLE